MTVAAWGDTAERRRRSRVELWGKMNQLHYGLVGLQPRNDKLMAVCATTVEASKRWIGDGKMETLLDNLKSHFRIDQDYIATFLDGTIMTKLQSPPHYTQGYDPSSASDEPISNGVAVRLYIPFPIPFPDAEIIDARIDGQAADESAHDGFLVRHNPGTIVQFNIPPKKVRELHIVTCHYKSATKRKYGFSPKDWAVE